MQLNNTHRVAIVAGLVKATYKHRFDALVKRTHEFAAQVWEHEHGELENTLRKKLTKEQLQKCFSTSPLFKVYCSDPREGNDVYVSKGLSVPFILGSRLDSAGKVSKEMLIVGELSSNRWRDKANHFLASGKLVTLEQKTNSDIHVLGDHSLRNELEALMGEQDALCKEAAKFMADMQSVVAGFTTDTKLVEFLPEAEPYIPRPKKKQEIVPMSTIEAVRQRINAKGGKQ